MKGLILFTLAFLTPYALNPSPYSFPSLPRQQLPTSPSCPSTRHPLIHLLTASYHYSSQPTIPHPASAFPSLHPHSSLFLHLPPHYTSPSPSFLRTSFRSSHLYGLPPSEVPTRFGHLTASVPSAPHPPPASPIILSLLLLSYIFTPSTATAFSRNGPTDRSHFSPSPVGSTTLPSPPTTFSVYLTLPPDRHPHCCLVPSPPLRHLHPHPPLPLRPLPPTARVSTRLPELTPWTRLPGPHGVPPRFPLTPSTFLLRGPCARFAPLPSARASPSLSLHPPYHQVAPPTRPFPRPTPPCSLG
jgi:hypothetical protein